MLSFIQIGPRWSDFYITLKKMSKVMYFIYSRLFRLCLALKRDIVDHRDIQLLFFFNKGRYQFLINVYSNSLYTVGDFFSNKALNIPNLLYIGENFNVRDAKWNLFISSYSTTGQTLRNLLDSYSLVCFILVLSVHTHYLNI